MNWYIVVLILILCLIVYFINEIIDFISERIQRKILL